MTILSPPAKRLKRRRRVRAKVHGSAVRPRISVFRSNRGISKQQVGEIAAIIRKQRPPEPYKGKGIRYQGEYVARKVGKRA